MTTMIAQPLPLRNTVHDKKICLTAIRDTPNFKKPSMIHLPATRLRCQTWNSSIIKKKPYADINFARLILRTYSLKRKLFQTVRWSVQKKKGTQLQVSIALERSLNRHICLLGRKSFTKQRIWWPYSVRLISKWLMMLPLKRKHSNKQELEHS